jgi:hypothetical protein
LRAATRRADGICNYDQKAARAITPTPGSGTRLLPTHVDPVACRIIVVTVDTAKFVEATKQAKRDTLVKPAVIYTYPPDRFAKDSTARAKAPVVKTVPPPVKPDSSTVTLFRHAPHGTTVFQMPAKVDTAGIRWMKDTVRVELTDRRRDMVIGEPRVRGDTAWVRASRMETKLGVPTYEFAIDYLLVRRGGRWTFTNQLTMMHSHFAPPPKTHAPVKPRPDTVRTFRSENPATAPPESFRDVLRRDSLAAKPNP